MTGNVQDFRTSIWILYDRLNDQANFGELSVLGPYIAREARRPSVNADASDKPSVNRACFGWKANLCVRASDVGLRAVNNGQELLKNGARPDGIALGGIQGIWRGYVANGDEVREIFGVSWRWKKPRDIIGGEWRDRLGRGHGRRSSGTNIVAGNLFVAGRAHQKKYQDPAF